MEVVRNGVATGASRGVLNLSKAVGGAGGHRPALTGRCIDDVDMQTSRRIMHSDRKQVPGVHEQVLCRVRCVRCQRRRDGNWVGWCVRNAILRDKGEVDVLYATEEL